MSIDETVDRKMSQLPNRPDAVGDPRDRVFIGTSGWAYESWKPGFYPKTLPQKKSLEY